MPQFSLNDSTVKMKDGGANEGAVKVSEGNLDFVVAQTVNYPLSRGRLSTTRLGDEVPCVLNLSYIWEFIIASDGAPEPNPYEMLRFEGAAADWESSDTEDPCATPHAVDVEVIFDLNCTAEETEVYLFNMFRYDTISPNGGSASIAVAGRCKVTAPTITRV